MAGQLEGRRVVVTGGASGIGAAAVQVLAEEGATVAATYHQTPPPDDLTPAAAWWCCDVRDADAIGEAFSAMADTLGGIDFLLQAAGRWEPSVPESLTEEELDALMATNLKGTVFANQAAFEHMRETGGHILNVGSNEGMNGNPIAPIYSMTKAAVHVWTRSAARAWGRYNIRVNALSPAVDTPGADRLRAHLGPDGDRILAERLQSMSPLRGALGDPVKDLGPVLVFLASAGSAFITGQAIVVDGGLNMVGK